MIVKIYIGNDQVKLQKAESISITSSVLSIQDITKNTTDYSRAFTVPANEENNKLFKHYYDANIDNTFDARIKVDGRIEIDGVRFRVGKFLLQKVNVKQGKPTSYIINFFGNLVGIADALGKDQLSDLNLSAFNHDYNSSNVLYGLRNVLFNGDIIYNLMAKKQYYYNSSGSDFQQTDKVTNIAYTSTGTNGVRYSDLKPSIRLLKIIEAIETDYGLTFTRHFFGRSEFSELYLWLNSELGNDIGGAVQMVNFDSGDNTYMNLITNIGEYLTRNSTHVDGWQDWKLYLTITPDPGFELIPYTINMYDGDNLIAQKKVTPITGQTQATLYTYLTSGSDSLKYFDISYTIDSQTNYQYSASLDQNIRNGLGSVIYETFASSSIITNTGSIALNIPKIEILTFLKGIFNACKLVVIPQKDGTIYVNTLKDYYAEGQLFNITKYIDFENVDIERGNILNTISYKFQEPSTILNKQFKINTGQGYGDELAILKDNNGILLDGESSTIEIPFEQFIYDRLIDVNGGATTDIMVCSIVDEKTEPTNPKPHIFYNINTNIGTATIGYLKENDIKIPLTGNINTAFHSNAAEQSTYAFLFSEEFSTWNGEKLSNNLYTNYHRPYINNIFNIKRRNFTFTSKILPLSILANLDLNDIVQIKENYYRIDKFTTDIITGKTEFNLVNAFDFTLNSFSIENTSISLTSIAQSYSAHVTNLTNYTVTKVDNGAGIDWLTITDDGAGNLILTVTENEIGLSRDIFINLVKNDTLQEINIYLTQGPGIQKGVLDFSNNLNGVYQTLLLTGKI